MPALTSQDTIFALSSASGKAGVSVVRVSGSLAEHSLAALLQENKAVKSRKATLCHLVNPVSRETIDHAVVVRYENPSSFTGEDCVEYFCHGAPAIIKELLSVLEKQKNHRLAEPGEFTRRAFENGKLDLTEAEAVADLINAETLYQKKQALTQLSGGLSDIYRDWALRLKKTLAYTEASIDFADEDLPEDFLSPVLDDLAALKSEMMAHVDDDARGEILRDGVKVAILGVPNAGKSSLLNLLARRDVAIVSDVQGTTRDILDVSLDIGGYPVLLSDTAGLRAKQLEETDHDRLEQEGIRRARLRAEEADLRILLIDGARPLGDQADALALKDKDSITVWNKSDRSDFNMKDDKDNIAISTETGEGIDVLLAKLTEQLESLIGRVEAPSMTSQRHRAHVNAAIENIERALSGAQIDMIAEDVRLAMRELGRITGRVDVEDLLDMIFKDFCIGK
jgi:tRNA modification GTPase